MYIVKPLHSLFRSESKMYTKSYIIHIINFFIITSYYLQHVVNIYQMANNETIYDIP